MENASKALLMASTVLIGVMLLSLGVYLFTTFGNFSADMTNQMNEKNLSEFNAQFTKYESYLDESGHNWINTCRAQDVVSVANLARENNSKYDYTIANESDYYYIKVIVKRGASTLYNNFEAENLDSYKNFLKGHSGTLNADNKYEIIQFKCTDIKFNPDNQRVCSITFTQL